MPSSSSHHIPPLSIDLSTPPPYSTSSSSSSHHHRKYHPGTHFVQCLNRNDQNINFTSCSASISWLTLRLFTDDQFLQVIILNLLYYSLITHYPSLYLPLTFIYLLFLVGLFYVTWNEVKQDHLHRVKRAKLLNKHHAADKDKAKVAQGHRILSEEELKFSEMSTSNCLFQIKNIRISNNLPHYEIEIVHKDVVWSVWRTFRDIENVKHFMIRDIPSLQTLSFYPAFDGNEGSDLNKFIDERGDPTLAVIRCHQVTMLNWIHSLSTVSYACNHFEFRRFLGLPRFKYPHVETEFPGRHHADKQTAHQVQPLSTFTVIPPKASSQKKKNRDKIVISTNINHQGSSKEKEKEIGRSSLLKRLLSKSNAVKEDNGGVNKVTEHGHIHENGSHHRQSAGSPVDIVGSPTEDSAVLSDEESPQPSEGGGEQLVSGTCLDDLEFLDISDAAKSIYQDPRFTHEFKVRGKNYAADGKKVPSPGSVAKLLGMELFEVKEGDRDDHVASKGLMKRRVDAVNSIKEPPFLFILNFQIPGDPPVSIVATFGVPQSMAVISPSDDEDTKCFKRLWKEFINMPATEDDRLRRWGVDPRNPSAYEPDKSSWNMPSDITWAGPFEPGAFPPNDFKNQRFKLIPTMTRGPWVVLAAVRNKPTLLGQKVVQRYFSGKNYIEVDVHVGSSIIATQIVSVCRGYAKHFSCNIGVILQGEDEEELPERVLCCITLHNIDVDIRRPL